jgi:hypothetical protein
LKHQKAEKRRNWHSIRELHNNCRAKIYKGTPQDLIRVATEAKFLHQDFSVNFFLNNFDYLFSFQALATNFENKKGKFTPEKLRKWTPKMHWLYHASEFLQEHLWWALVNEQAIEHIHAQFNKLVNFHFINQNPPFFSCFDIKIRKQMRKSC